MTMMMMMMMMNTRCSIQCRFPIFQSCIFQPCTLVPHFPVSHFQRPPRRIHVRRSLAVAGPSIWNSLPPVIRDQSLSSQGFRRLLKTCLDDDRGARAFEHTLTRDTRTRYGMVWYGMVWYGGMLAISVNYTEKISIKIQSLKQSVNYNTIQEAQLMLTNPRNAFRVNHGHQT